MSSLELLQRRYDRERAARKAAESLLEGKSLEVFQANQKLRDLADQTKAIVETAAEGIISYDRDGIIRSFNRSAERTFRIQSAIGKDIRHLFLPQDSVESVLFPMCLKLDVEHEDTVNESCVLEPSELVAMRGTDTPFFAEVAVSRNTRDNVTLFTMLVRDLTSRKKLEARLGQAQKMESVGQLAAGIAHEINTPIQFIGDNIKFLQGAFEDLNALLDVFQELAEAVAKGRPADGLLQQISRQSEIVDLQFLRMEFPGAIQQSLEGIERVAGIVRTMKEFSQPASESKSSVDLNRAIENALAVSLNQYREVATVETALDTTLAPVFCLSAQINQCLLNILTNAFEAMAEHCEPGTGRLRVTTRRDGESIELRFDDNGPGIPANIIQRIFDPFFTTKEVGKGTGQGLAFVYDVIVDKHDGTVHAQSSPGGGTTVVVSLPIAISPAPSGRTHANFVG